MSCNKKNALTCLAFPACLAFLAKNERGHLNDSKKEEKGKF
jgi:hypothetical protein